MDAESDWDSDSYTPANGPSQSTLAGDAEQRSGQTEQQVEQPTEQSSDMEEGGVMDISNIQGSILTGYLKDQQTIIFLNIVEGEESNFHRWFATIEPLLGTRGDVSGRSTGSRKSHSRLGEYNNPQASRVNIAFSVDELARLSRTAPPLKRHYFAHEGLVPTAIPGGDNRAGAVLIVSSDGKKQMAETVARIEDTIIDLRDEHGRRIGSGVEVMFKQVGATLGAPPTGHEQFGPLARDGEGTPQSGSGPRLSTQLEDFLAPRQHSNNRKHEKSVEGSATAWASKQFDQATDSVYLPHKRVTYSAISCEYSIDVKGIQENSERLFVPTHLGLPGIVPSNYLRAWRNQIPHHTLKGMHTTQPRHDAHAAEDHARKSARPRLDRRSN